ncbi:sulfurtransferase TusA family protein [Geoalkalibacter halelectricus]|uniref:Sulfurtransferase TusA family protein n=1 Tax=Geoalkalibacter halelectricus TaxID=2847045 RepID=A0ABY5ZI64_9BACT|nr:sulfurtransferase TusA family protein [Geoalkalibacter halelectricus]MDO3379354.1 sulfurtransferase TusA family protein [Geoalkalibacter halelectricus]UWZ78768.1 sulfurtransferase TusA family protein [Geoalkalibacter halelectricus]
MGKKVVDARGLSCPQPVVLVLQALAEPEDSFDVIMDRGASCDNIRRTLEGKKIKFDVREENGHTVYSISR